MVAETWKTLKNEDSDLDLYLDEVIPKPWGLEFRVYCDNFFDIWKLTLFPRESTSTHCHPRKETALLCLAGNGSISFLDQEFYQVSAGDIVFIPKGVFHSTENTGNSSLELIEVETPRNKFDLVRLSDRYGRSGTEYEKEVASYELLGMKRINYASGAKIRKTCHENRFRFGLVGALELICGERPGLMFAVPLGLESAFSQEIEVLTSVDPREIDENTFYFTISSDS